MHNQHIEISYNTASDCLVGKYTYNIGDQIPPWITPAVNSQQEDVLPLATTNRLLLEM